MHRCISQVRINYQMRTLAKYQRQEIYQYLEPIILFTKISKLSKSERSFLLEIHRAKPYILTLNSGLFSSRKSPKYCPFYIYLAKFFDEITFRVNNDQTFSKTARWLCHLNKNSLDFDGKLSIDWEKVTLDDYVVESYPELLNICFKRISISKCGVKHTNTVRRLLAHAEILKASKIDRISNQQRPINIDRAPRVRELTLKHVKESLANIVTYSPQYLIIKYCQLQEKKGVMLNSSLRQLTFFYNEVKFGSERNPHNGPMALLKLIPSDNQIEKLTLGCLADEQEYIEFFKKSSLPKLKELVIMKKDTDRVYYKAVKFGKQLQRDHLSIQIHYRKVFVPKAKQGTQFFQIDQIRFIAEFIYI
ncbi:hypothetical protein FGO68_gene4041 [Halteria grandinella]|uniref:Uncharacterized protein n=1 Tax=Halteria grandinella TaxID=5974 RepID=A0A8J8NLB1_HALGN|nr:hypothetical protein FGO68_gene4041 [Halteria grandinella]